MLIDYHQLKTRILGVVPKQHIDKYETFQKEFDKGHKNKIWLSLTIKY